MEEEIQKIKEDRDSKMNEILGHGEKLTDQMNYDRLMLFTSNLELKKLKEEAKVLGDEVERLED